MAIDIDASDQTGFSGIPDIKFGLSDGSIVTKYLPEYKVPRYNTSVYIVIWLSMTFDRDVNNMTVYIRTDESGIAYIDNIALYTADQNKAYLHNINPIIATFPSSPNYIYRDY